METFLWRLSEFFGWLLRSSVYAGVLVCLVLLIGAMVRRRLAARWHYLLWLVVVVRMMMPWAPQSTVSILNLIPDSARQRARAFLSAELVERDSRIEPLAGDLENPLAGDLENPQPDAAIAPATRPAWRVLDLLGIVWLAGALILGAYVFAANFRMWRIIKRIRPLTDQRILDLLEDCKGQAAVETLLGIVVTDEVRSPALFGFIRPRLLLPAGIIETQSPGQLRHIFLHELSHLKRHDILLGWITSLLLVVHWFNPLLWYAFYRMRQDRELACDASALSVMGTDEAQEYGRTIVRMLERFSCGRALPVMAAVSEDNSNLRKRITMISQFRKEPYAWSAFAVMLLVALGFVALTDAKEQASVSTTRENLTEVLTPPLSEMPGAELLERIADYTDAAAVHFQTLEHLESAMEEETTAYQRLEDLLEGEDFGPLKADDIIAARRYLRAAMSDSQRAKAGLVLLVLAGATMVRAENVFTDDFKGDGEKARFVIEAEHYSSRSCSSREGWWEVDGGSHRFIEGPGKGKDAPTADKLRAGEDAAGEDTRAEESESSMEKGAQVYMNSGELVPSTKLGPRIEVGRSTIDSTASRRRTRGDYKARGNYMLVAGVSVYPVDPTDSSYDGAFVDYRVAVQTPGEYRLFARWLGLDLNTDSFYAYIIRPDGTVLKGAGPEYFIFHQCGRGWKWDSRGVANTPYSSLAGFPDTPIWKITKPGEYTIRVAQRETNTALDVLVFQTGDLPKPDAAKLTESRFVDKPADNKKIVAIRVRLETALAQRREALQSIDEALARERLLYEALEGLLASGEYADSSKSNLIEAKQKALRIIKADERSREALAKAAEQLEGALKVLGWTPPPPPQPVASWNFDEGQGTAAGDSAGENHGTIHGAEWTDGKFGKALSFDGVDDYVEVADDPSLRFMQSSSFTISCWVMPAAEGEGGQILSKMRSAGGGVDSEDGTSKGPSPRLGIWHGRSGLLNATRQVGVFGYHMGWSSTTSAFGFAAESSWKGAVSTKTGHDSAPAGSWYHVAAVYSGTDVRIYLNGELKDRRTFDLDTGSTTPDKDLVIGALSYDSTISRFFAGKIDEVCIYDGALSGTQIKALYQRDR